MGCQRSCVVLLKRLTLKLQSTEDCSVTFIYNQVHSLLWNWSHRQVALHLCSSWTTQLNTTMSQSADYQLEYICVLLLFLLNTIYWVVIVDKSFFLFTWVVILTSAYMHRWRSSWFSQDYGIPLCFFFCLLHCLSYMFCVNVIRTQIALHSSNVQVLLSVVWVFF